MMSFLDFKVWQGPLQRYMHKATGLTVLTVLTGTIPVEHKSVHWLSMGAGGRNHL